ncbi:ABC transporter ATP-binding protein [Patescibacteria group bacterium]|jgi:ABC-2 type transport system ATP-binding protein|nr:ABC transporter ATP-binding protein [Patescibacteria group bacterium]
MERNILEVTSLSKNYGGTEAVKNISFAVRPREIVGLLGPNGAGKTTTIDMVLGVLKPTDGSILIGGRDVASDRSEALALTNFAAVYAQLPGNLTVYQNLKFFGLLYGVPHLERKMRDVMADFDIERFKNIKYGVLSSGEQTRVSLAKAMLNDPHLLLLDEPTASLDPSTAEIIRKKIRDHISGNTAGVLWTSHNMYEVTDVCDRVLFLSHGEILLEGDPKVLPRQYGKKNLEELFIAVTREPLIVESV